MTLVNFTKISVKECGEKLVDVEECGFIAEPKYYQQGMSRDNKIYLRRGVLERLKKAKENLPAGYNFKIWDGYRSREVQDNIWQSYYQKNKLKHPVWSEEEILNETDKFVTRPNNPERIPPHATGGAVDLTVVDKDGEEMNFGTEFDDFSEKASKDYFEVKNNLDEREKKFRDNRRMLRATMLEQGFSADEDEWWHFDYGNQLWASRENKLEAIYGEKS